MKTVHIFYNPNLKKFANKLRKNMTPAEILLWCQLQKKQMLGFDFDRQKPIDLFIVDFYSKELQLAIEVDGISHDFPQVSTRDQTRQSHLEKLGVNFLRFAEQEIHSNLEGVLEVIREWIKKKGFFKDR